MHPFQPFMLGQKIYPIRVAIKMKIPLIFYGENEAEHGNPISDNSSSTASTVGSFMSLTLKVLSTIFKFFAINALGDIRARHMIKNYTRRKSF